MINLKVLSQHCCQYTPFILNNANRAICTAFYKKVNQLDTLLSEVHLLERESYMGIVFSILSEMEKKKIIYLFSRRSLQDQRRLWLTPRLGSGSLTGGHCLWNRVLHSLLRKSGLLHSLLLGVKHSKSASSQSPSITALRKHAHPQPSVPVTWSVTNTQTQTHSSLPCCFFSNILYFWWYH